MVHLSRVEHRLLDVKHLLVLVLPALGLSSLYLGLADGESRSSANFLKVLDVSTQEVAVKLLEYFCRLHFKLFELEVGIVCLHIFDGPGAGRLCISEISSLDGSLNSGVLGVLNSLLQVLLELFVIFTHLPNFLVLFTFVEL